jgi:hypothetical protein
MKNNKCCEVVKIAKHGYFGVRSGRWRLGKGSHIHIHEKYNSK